MTPNRLLLSPAGTALSIRSSSIARRSCWGRSMNETRRCRRRCGETDDANAGESSPGLQFGVGYDPASAGDSGSGKWSRCQAKQRGGSRGDHWPGGDNGDGTVAGISQILQAKRGCSGYSGPGAASRSRGSNVPPATKQASRHERSPARGGTPGTQRRPAEAVGPCPEIVIVGSCKLDPPDAAWRA